MDRPLLLLLHGSMARQRIRLRARHQPQVSGISTMLSLHGRCVVAGKPYR
jgi:hypothetical protein